MIYVYCVGLLMLGVLSGFILCLLVTDIKTSKEIQDLNNITPFEPVRPVVVKDSLKLYEYKCKTSKELASIDDREQFDYIIISKLMSQMRKAIRDNLVSEYDYKTKETIFTINVWFRK